jgi:hypothetical protein
MSNLNVSLSDVIPELQTRIGALVFENAVLAKEVERLTKLNEELKRIADPGALEVLEEIHGSPESNS